MGKGLRIGIGALATCLLMLGLAGYYLYAPGPIIERWCGPLVGEARDYCVRQQRGAHEELQRFSGAVRRLCERQWGESDFQSVLRCTRDSYASKSSNRRALADEIETPCIRAWKGEYWMQKACTAEERALKELLEKKAQRQSGDCELRWGGLQVVQGCSEQ